MPKKFPHLSGAPAQFGPGREVYEQIPGEFDYSRWEEAQAHVRLTTVPWCGDYDNVPEFATEDDRDAYLDARDGYAFDTLWRMPPESTYNVDVPYTSALYYNYLVIDLPTETSDARPLPNVVTDRVRRLCYFVMDAHPAGEGTSALDVSLDVWTTYMCGRVSVDYVTLARGHAPMAEVSADAYLAAPSSTSAHLLTPDVGVGAPSYARPVGHVSFNAGSMYFCIATTADLTNLPGQYGTVAASGVYNVQGTSAPRVWACLSSSAATLVNQINASEPALLETIRAAFFVQQSLVQVTSQIDFHGVTLYALSAVQQTSPLVTLTKTMFGYDERYQNVAKLYTYPYACVEVSDLRGHTHEIHVEDTTGEIEVQSFASLAFPYLAIDCQIAGVGSGTSQISVQGLSPNVYEYVGSALDTMLTLDIPVFEIYQQASVNYDWSAHYVNAQRSTAAANQLASSLASNSTSQTNTSNSADNVEAQNALAVALNSAQTAAKNSANTSGVGLTNNKLKTDVQYDIGNSNASFDAQMAQLGVAATNNDARAAVSGTTTVVSTVASAAASALSGDIGGAVGAVAGGIASGAQTAVDWQTSNASITVSQSNNELVYNQAVTSAYGKQDASLDYNTAATSLANSTATTLATNQNNTMTSQATNNASLMRTNAANSKTTADANANRANATQLSAITNDTAQAALAAPVAGSTFSANASAVTKPLAVVANVKTASPGDIARAGETFLRYGYACDFSWHVTDWCPCERFCYWQVSDAWFAGASNVSERYQQEIKAILVRGTTVWKNPDDIGRVSVYDNGF